ncbi:MAG TPA: amino acid permease, partial [Dyella sp.]|nr:amino acid permease [Dyella sp.]
RSVGQIDARWRAPQVALGVLGLWAIVLIITGTFDSLVNYTTVGEWLGHAFGIATLFWYRRKFGAQSSPYRVPLYPVLPFVFVATVLGVIAATVISTPHDAGMSLVIIVLGVPVYALWRRWSRQRVSG